MRRIGVRFESFLLAFIVSLSLALPISARPGQTMPGPPKPPTGKLTKLPINVAVVVDNRPKKIGVAWTYVGSVPYDGLHKVSAGGSRRMPVLVTDYGEYGYLLWQVFDRRSDGSKEVEAYPSSAVGGQFWMIFKSSTYKVVRHPRNARKIYLAALRPIEVIQRAFFLTGSNDGLSKTPLGLMRPHVPIGIRHDPDPVVQDQLARLDRPRFRPQVVFYYGDIGRFLDIQPEEQQ